MRAALCAILISLGLSACATQNLSIRSLPPETPAADNATVIENAAALAAAKASATQGNAAQEGDRGAILLTAADAPSMYSYDPWERLNRFTYRFNARFDEAVFLPTADQYRRLPGPIRSGVHNFFANLDEVKTVVNYILQLHPAAGAHSLGRFVINSTIGVGGLFDVAVKFHLKREPTGLSTTLARWGMHPGPYLVIPILGPATLRDGVGLLADYGVSYVIDVAHLYRGYQTWALGTVDALDERANVSFRYYATGSPFEYETVRFLYVHRELIEDAALHATEHPPKQDPTEPAGR
jgi:phospholipid-binding lipoprotein MlaA